MKKQKILLLMFLSIITLPFIWVVSASDTCKTTVNKDRYISITSEQKSLLLSAWEKIHNDFKTIGLDSQKAKLDSYSSILRKALLDLKNLNSKQKEMISLLSDFFSCKSSAISVQINNNRNTVIQNTSINSDVWWSNTSTNNTSVTNNTSTNNASVTNNTSTNNASVTNNSSSSVWWGNPSWSTSSSTSPVTIPAPTCWTAVNYSIKNKPSDNLCWSWRLNWSVSSSNGKWKWSCINSNNSKRVSCSANITKVNWECWSLSNPYNSISNKPSTSDSNLCKVGTIMTDWNPRTSGWMEWKVFDTSSHFYWYCHWENGWKWELCYSWRQYSSYSYKLSNWKSPTQSYNWKRSCNAWYSTPNKANSTWCYKTCNAWYDMFAGWVCKKIINYHISSWVAWMRWDSCMKDSWFKKVASDKCSKYWFSLETCTIDALKTKTYRVVWYWWYWAEARICTSKTCWYFSTSDKIYFDSKKYSNMDKASYASWKFFIKPYTTIKNWKTYYSKNNSYSKLYIDVVCSKKQ